MMPRRSEQGSQENHQQVLEDSIAKMGVWITRHPSGTLRIQQGLEHMHIFPHENRWTYRIRRFDEVYPYRTGFYTRKDVQLFVHEILKWSWRNGAGKY